jgi:MFS family permease
MVFAGRKAKRKHETEAEGILLSGTLLGIIAFGLISDRIGRKVGMIFASLWIAFWSLISGLAYGAGGSTGGLIKALIAYRFLLGIGVRHASY